MEEARKQETYEDPDESLLGEELHRHLTNNLGAVSIERISVPDDSIRKQGLKVLVLHTRNTWKTGAQYVYQYLKEHGFDVEFLYDRFGTNRLRDIGKVKESDILIVSPSLEFNTPSLEDLQWQIEDIRRVNRDIFVVAGGIDTIDMYSVMNRFYFCDLCIRYQGMGLLTEILPYLSAETKRGGKLDNLISALLRNVDGSFCATIAGRSILSNLDQFNLDKKLHPVLTPYPCRDNSLCSSIFTSIFYLYIEKGCPYLCRFCQSFQRRFAPREMTVEDIVIKLIRAIGVTLFDCDLSDDEAVDLIRKVEQGQGSLKEVFKRMYYSAHHETWEHVYVEQRIKDRAEQRKELPRDVWERVRSWIRYMCGPLKWVKVDNVEIPASYQFAYHPAEYDADHLKKIVLYESLYGFFLKNQFFVAAGDFSLYKDRVYPFLTECLQALGCSMTFEELKSKTKPQVRDILEASFASSVANRIVAELYRNPEAYITDLAMSKKWPFLLVLVGGDNFLWHKVMVKDLARRISSLGMNELLSIQVGQSSTSSLLTQKDGRRMFDSEYYAELNTARIQSNMFGGDGRSNAMFERIGKFQTVADLLAVADHVDAGFAHIWSTPDTNVFELVENAMLYYLMDLRHSLQNSYIVETKGSFFTVEDIMLFGNRKKSLTIKNVLVGQAMKFWFDSENRDVADMIRIFSAYIPPVLAQWRSPKQKDPEIRALAKIIAHETQGEALTDPIALFDRIVTKMRDRNSCKSFKRYWDSYVQPGLAQERPGVVAVESEMAMIVSRRMAASA